MAEAIYIPELCVRLDGSWHRPRFWHLFLEFVPGVRGSGDWECDLLFDGCLCLCTLEAQIQAPVVCDYVRHRDALLIWTWSDFFSQLIFLNTLQIFTLPVALRTFLDSTGTSSYGGLFAMSILSLLPIFGFFLAFQRLLTEGISTTGMKG